MPDYTPLFEWVVERESIRKKKEAGKPFPWTDDPILRGFRFCNVRREDDRGTVWIRENIREPFAEHPNLWFMLCIARQINWPDTLKALIDRPKNLAWPTRMNLDITPQIADVMNARKDAGLKVYTGAYMISAPSVKGMDKQRYIAVDVLGDLWKRRFEYDKTITTTLQSTHEWITRTKGWGQFMAYQAVVDMRFTSILNRAPDTSSWAAAGPGTLRGLNRLYSRPLEARISQEQALVEMRQIYRVVEWETSVMMDFSDVPNILCETDKYLRVKNGKGKPRARYIEGRGS